MYEELLLELGLTNSEIAVYLALLRIGPSKTGPIIKKAKVSAGKVYFLLNKLAEKGLVTHTIISGTKYYQAKNPERIVDYANEKEKDFRKKKEQLLQIIPKLKEQYEIEKYQPKAEVYEGVKGFKTLYESILKDLEKGDKVDILGAPREADEKFEPYFMDWNRRREKKGIKMRIIYNHDCREFGVKREKFKLTEVRYMKQELETPAWIDIYKDFVVTINVHGTPICFLIKNKETADSYKKYFEILWKQAKK